MEQTTMRRAQLSFAGRHHLFKYFRHVILLAWAVIILFPIFWMISTSFKDIGEWVSWPPHWIPEAPTVLNYRQIFARTVSGFDEKLARGSTEQTFNIWKSVQDSLILSVLGAMVSVLLGSWLSYSISRFGVGGKNFRYLILTIRMVPPIVVAIPIMMYYSILIPHTTQIIFGERISMYD
jgi:multiple sugar transport system permease protein